MKRKAKQNGSGGRLRLGLLMATAAAFLLVPAAGASAESDTHIVGAGEGSGELLGVEGVSGEGGVPRIECHWNGALGEWDVGTSVAEGSGVPGLNQCETDAQNLGGIEGVKVEQKADSGSEFVEWNVEGGALIDGCEGTAATCTVIFPPTTITTTFEPEPPKYPLNLTTSGTGSGSFQCDTGSGPEACEAEYAEGTEVTVTANPDTGAELGTVSGTGSAAACAASPCTVTMTEEGSINAEFNVETFDFAVTVIGEGTVECNVNGGGLAACPTGEDVLTFGDEVEVVAEPISVEYKLEKLSGTGSASGCEAEGSPCTFTVKADSSVEAEFVTAAGKDEAEGNVHGEVPQTTTLEAAGCADVDLGEFIPGEGKEYAETCVATLTSTGAETTFTASDPSAESTGHLVHSSGAYALVSPLEVMAEDAQGLGTGPLTPQPLSPVTMLTFEDPIANDATTLTFEQPIGAEEGLLTGEYAKTILLTLQQTA